MIKQTTRLTEMHISNIKVERRFRRHMGDIEALKDSIREVGLLQPIVITSAGVLIAGERRLEACRRLGLRTIRCCVADSFPDVWAELLAEVQENTCRKRFLPSEAVAAAQEMEPFAKAAAWRRKIHAEEETAEKFSEAGQSMDHIARIVDLSRPTLEKAIKVVEAAREEPGKYQDLVEKMDQTGKVNGAYIELIARQGKSRTNRSSSISIRIDKHGAARIAGSHDKSRLIASLKVLLRQLES